MWPIYKHMGGECSGELGAPCAHLISPVPLLNLNVCQAACRHCVLAGGKGNVSSTINILRVSRAGSEVTMGFL